MRIIVEKNLESKINKSLILTLICLYIVTVSTGCIKKYDENQVNENVTVEKYKSISSSTELGLVLLDDLMKDNPGKDIAISPTSLNFALGMIQLGAEGETKEQIQRIISDQDNIDENMKKLLSFIQWKETEELKLSSSNSLWYTEVMDLKETYKENVVEYYNSEFFKVNFTDKKTTVKMNDWISKKTDGIFKEVIKEFDKGTCMVLLNTLYFKGQWKKPFDQKFTLQESFYTDSNTSKTVDMMNQGASLVYFEAETYQMCRLDYKDGVHMVIILPKDDLATYISTVSSEELEGLFDLNELANNDIYKYVNLSLPKFEITNTHLLKDNLKNLGMIKAFDMNNSEFGEMFETKVPIYVSKVQQDINVSVNEEGTIAAAVTKMDLLFGGMPEEPITMKCNKPFFYAIVENKNGEPYFMGIYNGKE